MGNGKTCQMSCIRCGKGYERCGSVGFVKGAHDVGNKEPTSVGSLFGAAILNSRADQNYEQKYIDANKKTQYRSE